MSNRVERADLRRAFTEAVDPEVIGEHSQQTVVYRAALRRLAAGLNCEATEDGVLRARAAEADPLAYANRLLRKSGTGLMILDHGFSGGEAMSAAEHSVAIDIPQREVVRLETMAQTAVASCANVAEWLMAVRELLMNAVNGGAVGVKTIAAYRAGLQLQEPDRSRAEADFKALRARAADQSIRLEGEPLCHLLLLEAAQLTAELGVPLQIHCGFGDPDEDLALTNPLGLRRLFVEPRFDGLKVVLLHCYPYHRQAAYLASVFPGVYMDVSLAIPMAAHDGARALLEALGLCPTTKLLYATDATRFPEVYLVAAALHREALAGALGQLVNTGWLTQSEAVEAGRQVLSGNARRIYELPE